MTDRQAMIVAPQPEAVEAGAEILRAGGNAVDAALACAFVQGVVDPMMCGIAGFGSMAVYDPAKSAHEYIDFHAPAPAAATPEMWQDLIEGEARDGYGFILKGRVNDIGYQSICVPASLAAHAEAHKRHGRMPWAELLAPAIEWARKGWTVRPHVTTFWSDEGAMGRVSNQERLRHTPAGKALYCREDGTPKKLGDRVENPDMAAVLEAIARDGADAFYRGDIATAIDADMRANGGLLRLVDLENYRPKILEPIRGSYRGYEVTSNQPPGGGVMLLQMLNILENFDLAATGHNTPEYLRIVCEAMKYATVDKDRSVGDPDFVEVPLDRLLDRNYARELAEKIRAGEIADVPRLDGAGLPQKDTTHISVVDKDGACVSMTHSLGMPSGVVTKGLGFMYNGCMGVFDPRPGRAGSIAPGKARFSSICPSIIFRDGAPVLVIGAPGATQIAMGVLQAVLNVLDHGMTMAEAVAAPRFSSTSRAIDVMNRIPARTTDALAAKGYEIIRSPASFGIAWVHGIRVQGTKLDGGADPGADGMALSV